MRKLFWILSSSLLLGSCASGPSYSQKMDSWQGHQIDEIIDSWGSPSETFHRPDGNTTYIWMQTNGSTTTYNNFLHSANSTQWFCKTEFTTDMVNRVVKWRGYGNACR